MSDWINALDNCASAGILDYDAAAYLLDKPARFVGHPKFEDMPPIEQPLLLPPNTKIKGNLEADTFQNNLVKNPSWKKWLFGALALAGGAFLVIGGLTKFAKIKIPKNIFNKATLKNAGTKVWNIIKTPFTWVSGKINPPKP